MIARKREIFLLLDNIRSVHNVGSIFRTAETAGISHIYCLDTTPVPIDRFGRKRSDFAKVALGAENMIPWEHIPEAGTLLKSLKKDGFEIVALEQNERSVDYKMVELKCSKVLVILGNEVEGVSKDLLKSADVVAEIPMQGDKESLNVSVAAGIFLYRLFDR
ncbi:MAG: tRNA/rRNA methyltransferase SpoU [Candidatus Parcubacteria bacterium]|nr:tRNA/rRNA methyltransferase SpoU [Candidatus Parcubacteria bacterium]